MRIKLDNWTDEDVMPYLALAAKVVSVPGIVHAKVHWVKRGSWEWYSGHAQFIGKSVRIGMPRHEYFKPFKRETLGYFHSHNIPLKKPYEVCNWHELLVNIAAHEFAHLMPNGQRYRKSVIEKFCEQKAAEAIELLRSEGGQQFVNNYHQSGLARLKVRLEKKREREAHKKSYAGKLDVLRAREKRWVTRSKRAATALKKIRRNIKRLEKLEAGQEAQSGALLANTISDTKALTFGIK